MTKKQGENKYREIYPGDTAELPKTTWEVLSAINCNEHTEKKKTGNGVELTYLSWAWAWGILKSLYPDASYTVREWDGKPYLYDEVLGYLVETTLTVNGETMTMRLPVMDGSNKAQKDKPYTYEVKNPYFQYAKWDSERQAYVDKFGNVQERMITKTVEAATMFDINTAIMRCLVKNMALFGLGHYIYAGEDLPQVEVEEKKAEDKKKAEEEDLKLAAACDDADACTTELELIACYNSHPEFQKDRTFLARLTAKKKEVRDAAGKGAQA